MIINRVAVGNKEEAYVENAFKKGINIISSDDNNKGKTIVIQSLIYCLGNTMPAFPASFDYKKYHYFVEFTHDDNNFKICRKGDTFVINSKDRIMFFDSISEMKYYWSKTIFPLPQIIKNGAYRIVDPDLFVQTFFVGQDKKDTANITNKGFYTKEDFINMIFSMANLGSARLSPEYVASTKQKINTLKSEKQNLQKQHKFLKSNNTALTYLSQYRDKNALSNKLNEIEKIKDKLSKLISSRNITINRKVKYEVVIKELNSLNRNISVGELRCLDCDSNRVGFAVQANKSYTFDVSTPEIRKQIIDSINEKISAYEENVEKYTLEINDCQKQLQQMLGDEDISIESLIIHKQEIINISSIESRLLKIDTEIEQLSNALTADEKNSDAQIKEQQLLISKIKSEMKTAYKQIDQTGTMIFDNLDTLFTPRDHLFSGSEATEFHLLKIYAIAKTLKHAYPLIIDSFRAEDLSTEKEKAVIALFSSLNLQTIFSTTIKAEETGKYQNAIGINNIDYSNNAPSKLLNGNFVNEFKSIVDQLSMTL